MWQFLVDNYTFILIPMISGLIGWGTNVLAIKMTFYPIEYKGIKPFGWQGIIPSKTRKMANKSVDLLTRDLFDTREIFARLNANEIANIASGEFTGLSKKITQTAMQSRMPLVWKHSPTQLRTQIESLTVKQIPDMLTNVMNSIKADINNILDLKELAQRSLSEDKTLINRIFLDMGEKQFNFIKISGLYLGILFGIGQIFTATYTNHWLMYVSYGVFIGYITNYLAIKMIFEPAEQKKLGPIKIQGLFLKNQKEEAAKYAQIIGQKILTVDNLFDAIFRKPNNQIVDSIISKEVSTMIDKIERNLPLTARLTLIGGKLNELKAVARYELMRELPLSIRVIFPYAHKTLDIENTIREKMSSLPPKKFIDFLRPAFQEDEWKLIAVGSALGGVAGLIQYWII